MSDSPLTISYYSKIADLNREHGVALVRHAEGGIYVRKDMQIYNRCVYEQLYAHPVKGIPRIYALYEDTERGILTVIEEYIAGDTLEKRILEGGPMAQPQAVECCLQLCDILEQLHGMKPAVIHRDIKPSNLIQREDGSIVLIDLNAARLEAAGEDRDTRLLGTAGYAAPEQYGFGQSSPKADIYAVGRLLTVLLTGDLQHTTQSSPDAASPVSKQLQRIIERCTRMNPEDRFPTVQALRRALQQEAKAAGRSAGKSSGKFFTGSRRGQEKVFIGSSRRQAKVFACLFAGIAAVFLLTSLLLHARPFGQNKVLPAQDAEQGTFDETAVSENPIVGVYKGDSSDYLELTADGLANYYLAGYTELACPWTETDGAVSIYLPKLHCTITAETGNVSSEHSLYFTSESAGWNDEGFQRCHSIPDADKKAALQTYEPDTVLQSDGTLLYEQCGLRFVLPRQYIDDRDSADSMKGFSEFFSSDAETHAYSLLMFYRDESSDPLTQESFQNRSQEFLERFYDHLDPSDSGGVETLTVADCAAYQWSFTGRFNSGFGSLGKELQNGCITMIYNEDTSQTLIILFSEYAHAAGTERGDYEAMLQEACASF